MDSIVTEKIRENAVLDQEDDHLHYYELAGALFEYIKSKISPISVGIYGKWGSGKSVLVNFMQEIFEEEDEYEFINFDAMSFSGDQNNIFWSLMAEIIEKKDEKGWSALATASTKAASAFSGSTGTIAKAVSGFLSDEKAREFLIKQSKLFEKDDKKYVVVIDNIDRLTPKAAINFLEKIKAFLLSESGVSLENFVYLIPCDFEILHAEVQQIYRNNSLDARDYLNKLIEVPFYLPQQQDGLIEKLADALMNQEIEENIRKRMWSVLKQFGLVMPRDIKNFLQELDMIFIIAKARGKQEEDLLEKLHQILFVQILKSKYLDLFNYLKINKTSYVPGNDFLADYYAFRFGGNLPADKIRGSDNPRSQMVCRENGLIHPIMMKVQICDSANGKIKVGEFDELVDIVDSASQRGTAEPEENVAAKR